MKLPTLAVLALALTMASCTSYSFGHRDEECDPDRRLDDLLTAYDEGRNEGVNSAGNVLVDCERARHAIERLALEFPAHTRTLMAAGTLAFEHSEPEKAQNYVDMVFRLQSAHPEAGILRSRIAIEEGNLPLARRVLDMQIQYTPDHAGLREAQSSVRYMSGDLAGARASIDAAEALGAPAWRVAFNRGLISEAAGDAAEARRHYEACLDAKPEYPQAKSRLSGMKAAGG